MGLKSPAFRNYADRMATEEFRAAIDELLSIAAATHTAVMCAEKFYWKCHRRLLSDYLTARGVQVEHIVESGTVQPHKPSKGAVFTADGTVCYPAPGLGERQMEGLFGP